MNTCTHSARLVRFSPMAALRGHRSCAHCGGRLQMSPGLDASAALLAMVLASQREALLPAQAPAWAASSSPWRDVPGAVVVTLALYCALKIAAAHSMPFRHVDAVDAASSRYRIVMALLVGIAVVVLAFMRPGMHG